MTNQKFFICKHCGNFVGLLNNSNVPMMCCGEPMTELVPNTAEAAKEKHIPDVQISGDTVSVTVGSVLHPGTAEHHIDFIYLQTEKGGQRKCIKVGDEPRAEFKLVDDTLLEVFAYCNLHGLWKIEIEKCGCEDETVCSADFSKGCI